MAGDALEPTAIQDESLLSHYVFTFIHINLIKPHLFEMWLFWQSENLNLAFAGSQSQASCSAVWCGWA
jgi:hypothetical protein